MNRFGRSSLAAIFLACSISVAQDHDPLWSKANRLAQEFLIVDTHIDVPYRIQIRWEDISKRTEKGDFDFIRARQGGLDAPFMSIYVPSEREFNGAKSLADSLIDMVEGFARRWPKKFAVAKSTADVKNQFDKGLMSLCMGMENGSPVEGKLENLRHFHSRGIRYITLTHGKDNHISDSSYDTTHTWKGLSPFGKQVVAEMNRLGIMVDISHVSDEAFYQVMEISKAPAIASHSSCRFYTPGFERNMSDDMIKLLAKNGGVIMINFGSSFLNDTYRQEESRQQKSLDSLFKVNNMTPRDSLAEAFVQQYRLSHPLPALTVADVVEHIDHVVKLAGVDHVGFGSDFDGVGDSLPIGIKDVSMYPNIIHGLLKKGYAEKDIEKICGGNLLRVWTQVEKKAKELQAKK